MDAIRAKTREAMDLLSGGIMSCSQYSLEQALALYTQSLIDLYSLSGTDESELNRFISTTHNHKGTALFHLGRYQEALNDYNEAIRLGLENSTVFFNRGRTLAEMELFDRAVEDLSRAISLYPKHAAAYYKRGLIYLSLERFNEAIDDFDKSLEIDGCSESVQKDREEASRLRGLKISSS